MLHFDSHFWGNAGRLVRLSDTQGEWPWFQTCPDQKGNILVAWSAGKFAREMQKMEDSEIIDKLMNILNAMFDGKVGKLIDYHITRWATNPFTLGSYSSHGVGCSSKNRKALATPQWNGSLYFCGEATSVGYFGTVHGAYLSGQRVANHLLFGKQNNNEM